MSHEWNHQFPYNESFFKTFVLSQQVIDPPGRLQVSSFPSVPHSSPVDRKTSHAWSCERRATKKTFTRRYWGASEARRIHTRQPYGARVQRPTETMQSPLDRHGPLTDPCAPRGPANPPTAVRDQQRQSGCARTYTFFDPPPVTPTTDNPPTLAPFRLDSPREVCCPVFTAHVHAV